MPKEELEYQYKESGGKRYLIFNFRTSDLSPDLATDQLTRANVIKALQEFDPNEIVLADVYERVYDEEETRLFKEIADLAAKLRVETPWAYGNLSVKGYDDPQLGLKHDAISDIASNLIFRDPILAYFRVLKEIVAQQYKLPSQAGKELEATKKYLSVLNYLKDAFEKTTLIKKVKFALSRLEKIPSTQQIYGGLFEAQVKPAFVSARLIEQPETEKFELVDSYVVLDSNVEIYKHPDKVDYLYFITPPEYSLSPEKYFILEKTKQVMSAKVPSSVVLSSVESTRKYFERIYESTIIDIAKENDIKLDAQDISLLAKLTGRYTVGYGILELLLSDRNLTDVYVDAPLGTKPIYVIHSEYGQCQTNIIYTEDEAKIMASKLRAISSRPFDEAPSFIAGGNRVCLSSSQSNSMDITTVSGKKAVFPNSRRYVEFFC